MSKAKRSKTPLSIGIFDIDNFKRINDTYGHPTGDLVLKKFAEIVQSKKRDYDIFGRFGGGGIPHYPSWNNPRGSF
ncbi:GGDEF domain-containing protein [Calditerrivibrio sp.]|uniref:GGDEF domain-containing protein n=1 Tax=Calditerrivibrio sp. TaxID=2792612 RepID=UPI003D0ACF3B